MPTRKIESFSYVSAPGARILILGSIPGVRSLEATQYYAHPRNAFWPIISSLLGFSAELPYPERLQQLTARGIALWDTVHRCERPGSLDQNIQSESVEANDFGHFFSQHPELAVIAFNGGAAFKLFKRHVINAGTRLPVNIQLIQLPSTSPAHAALRPEQKLTLWHEQLSPWLEPAC